MPVIRPVIGFALLVLLCAGCGKEPAGVAVVDLDEVAKRLGRDLSISKAVKENQDDLNQQLNTLLETLKQRFKQQSEEFGPEPTPEQQAQLRVLNDRMSSLMAQRQRQAQSMLVQGSRQLVVRFREEVKPVAKDVATEQGFAIVIPKDLNTIISVNDTVDITEQVIAKMQANPTSAPAAQPAATPAPKSAGETASSESKRTPSRTRTAEQTERPNRKG